MPFFVPGKVFPARIRHANATKEDDAGSNIRGLALKFADNDVESPLDILLNTGFISPLWDLPSFVSLTLSNRHVNELQKVDWAPGVFAGKIGGNRKAPTTYAHLIYYNGHVANFHAKDGRPRYCRFRVIPFEDVQESGDLTFRDQLDIMASVRDPNDLRPKNYLREEYKTRVASQEVKYKLQIQIREASPNDDLSVFNMFWSAWSTDVYPWLELAIIQANEIIPDNEQNKQSFNVARIPKDTITWPEAYSSTDFRSPPHARITIYHNNFKLRSLAGNRE